MDLKMEFESKKEFKKFCKKIGLKNYFGNFISYKGDFKIYKLYIKYNNLIWVVNKRFSWFRKPKLKYQVFNELKELDSFYVK